MYTRIVFPSDSTYAECAEIIKNDGIVAFPTETVYGLGANATSDKAVKEIFTAKGRPSDNPIIVHIADKKDIYNIAEDISPVAEKLIKKFMPGAITLVFKKKPCISDIVSAGLDTVGVRIPSSIIARNFIKACGVPIAAPSANTSSRPSPTQAIHVYEDLKDKVPVIIDGGSCEIGIESTVVDVTGDIPVILRPGKITLKDIIEVCGCGSISESLTSDKVKSPGVKYKHYAPICDAVLVKGSAGFFNKLYTKYLQQKRNPIILCYEDTAKKLGDINIISLGDSDEQAAAKLYGALRLAEKQADIILIESAKGDGIGASLMNRMRKSAGGNIIEEKL